MADEAHQKPVHSHAEARPCRSKQRLSAWWFCLLNDDCTQLGLRYRWQRSHRRQTVVASQTERARKTAREVTGGLCARCCGGKSHGGKGGSQRRRRRPTATACGAEPTRARRVLQAHRTGRSGDERGVESPGGTSSEGTGKAKTQRWGATCKGALEWEDEQEAPPTQPVSRTASRSSLQSSQKCRKSAE